MSITTSEAGPAIPEFWLAEAFGHLKANLVMGRLVRRDGDEAIAQEGDTININKRGSLTVRDKSEGSSVTADSPSNTKIDVKLDTHKYVAWNVEDRAGDKAIEQALDYVQDGMEGLAEAIDEDLLELYSDAGDDVGEAETDLDYSTILDTRKALNDLKCPVRGRNLVVSTKDEIALLDEDKIVEAHKRGDDGTVLEEATLGRIAGFDTFMSQLVAETGDSPTTTHNLAFHQNAFILATRPLSPPQEGTGALGTVLVDEDLGVAMRYTRQWDSNELRTKHVIDVLYGVKSVDADRLAIEVKS